MGYGHLKSYERVLLANLKNKNILIRCDASPAIGLGHITRCLVLANDFRDEGHNVYFAMRNYTLGITKAKENNFEVFIANEDNFNYNDWIQKIADDKKINIFIGDIRDALPIETIEELKQKNILTVAIDEPSDYRIACDLCFYPPVPQVDELDWTGFKGQIYKGFEYVILRPEFYKNYVKVNNKIPNILVMMGGTDPHNLTLKVLKQLLAKKEQLHLSVIMRKDHIDYDAIKSLSSNLRIYSDVKNMAEFLNGIDFAVITFGMSAYELLAMHIPAVHICLDDEHWKSSEMFEKNNFSMRINKKNLDNQIGLINIDMQIIRKLLPQCNVVPAILKEINNGS